MTDHSEPDPSEIDNQDDEGYAEESINSYVSSLASDIRKGILENGRTYPAHGANQIFVPIDDREQDRNDLQHYKFLLLMDNKLHLSPIGDHPSKILDLGTGSGIWAMDMADQYPSAQVIGVDVAPTQPTWVPPNCQFEIDDVEQDWLYPKESFDLIHVRDCLLSIRDWKKLIRQSYDCMKAGGYLEMGGTYVNVRCEDNSIPENSGYVEMAQIYREIGDAIGSPCDAPTLWKQQMTDAGFEEVEEKIMKLPASPWPKDERLKKVGAFEQANFLKGAEGFIMRGMVSVLGRSANEAHILAARGKAEVKDPKMHAYVL